MPNQVATTAAAGTPAPASPERRLLRFGGRAIVGLLALFLFLRVFVVEPCSIPTGSMKSTILEGDVVLVNKLPYVIRSPQAIPFTNISIPHFQLGGLGQLERGDVVVFDPPMAAAERGERFVKRCVALAGDTVQLLNGRVWVNGRELPPSLHDPLLDGEQRAGEQPDGTPPRRSPIDSGRANRFFSFGQPVVLPYEGYEIAMDSLSLIRWGELLQAEGVSAEFRNSIVFLGGLPATRYTFRRSYFLALGDNSGDSYDSRMFGPVPYDHLVGRAWFIYWSANPAGGMRWGRIGTCVE